MPNPATGPDDRKFWINVATRIARPVLAACAAGRLHATMPVESAPGQQANRAKVTHLEALARTLTGLAPWLELGLAGTDEETRLRTDLADLARRAIAQAADPKSPDHMNFTEGGQPLVDAAFLAHALLRAPRQLWQALPDPAKQNLLAALQSTRAIKPGMNNWMMFSAMVEAFLCSAGQSWRVEPVDAAVRRHMEWYKGDGFYGDGPVFHWDYYNSFVIQPMLIDVLEAVRAKDKRWDDLHPKVIDRAKRYAAIQERLISPEGTFPPIGRSLAYRFGAFQLLGQMALRHQLPERISPGQVRCALTAVIRRMIDAKATFDEGGWLTIGFCGHQPGIGEPYISTGSLYLCTAGLLPLGLPPDDEFWTDPPSDWTSLRAWNGQDLAADHAIKD
ncbi:MAG TPA: DUF2264 domain-containing protein [Tepidisphaeraceae bacterium]|jgi:hypothetical protein